MDTRIGSRRTFTWLVATLAMLLSACSAGAPPSTPVAATPEPTPDAFVADLDVGGHALHIVCVGPTDTGRPTVVFEAGLGGDFRTWGEPMGGLKATDRACSYDRAGNGMSPAVAGPRTTRDQVEDLHALLAAAGVTGPYLLVGYSIAGWNLLLYTAAYPDDVAGIVLVDVRPPGLSAAIRDLLPPQTAGESDAIHENRADVTVFEHDPSLNSEHLDLAASAAQALAAPGFGDRPTAVLWASDTAAIWEGLEPGLATALDDAGQALRTKMEGLSTDVTVTNVDAPHDIPGERPDAVLDAVKSVLARIAD